MKRWVLLVALGAAACSSGSDGNGSHAPVELPTDPVSLGALGPSLLIPGTAIELRGSKFVPPELGTSRLTLRGTFNGQGVELELPAQFIADSQLKVDWPGALAAGLGSEEGSFEGEALLTVTPTDDSSPQSSEPLSVSLQLQSQLAPQLAGVDSGDVLFVNDLITLRGEGFFLSRGEGLTQARLEGCFRRQGSSRCTPLDSVFLPTRPVKPTERTSITFAFDPRIAGIHPGSFEGSIRVQNSHSLSEVVTESESMPVRLELVPSEVFSVSPANASLGQYIDVQGGGFVGTRGADFHIGMAFTTLELQGSFLPDGASEANAVQVSLVPEFVSGNLVRYILNEQDELGSMMDLRKSAGQFTGTIRPVSRYATETLVGQKTQIQFAIAPIKQVVWLNFLPAYVGSLRHFGLRAMDQQIRNRVFTVASRDYQGINVEFRSEKPEDFAQFEQVDISGPDPNGYGLLGYDNTPGKDVGNTRLYDKIGGINATTQEDGYPGYGGVFVESFFGFSQHPHGLAQPLDGASAIFDQLFDPFRPDLGGHPVNAQDLAQSQIPELTSGEGCPAAERPMQIACAVWALGSMIGTTMTHEVAHSLGLADPNGQEFHNPGDGVNRLMDGGGYRTFLERTELQGEGPAVFCDEDYSYLKGVLPSPEPDPVPLRPSCW